ncbi:hypothetical protein RJ639_006235 [Escallonia herrerae]|uniref:Uncharacterized protein n=1 Tax=Escallonia herrerae TaxID=1293975 RepID=A0AA89AW59_9ASTE|nr:hypothetical protein RJ639_006235 [Escallonia herrerae]
MQSFMKQWQAVVFPLSLTSLMYVGSFFLKSLILLSSWKELRNQGGDVLLNCIKDGLQNCISWMLSVASNVSVWRNYIVSKPYTKRIINIKKAFGYQPPKFQQFDGKANPRQHIAHFIETCNDAGK